MTDFRRCHVARHNEVGGLRDVWASDDLRIDKTRTLRRRQAFRFHADSDGAVFALAPPGKLLAVFVEFRLPLYFEVNVRVFRQRIVTAEKVSGTFSIEDSRRFPVTKPHSAMNFSVATPRKVGSRRASTWLTKGDPKRFRSRKTTTC